MKVKPKHLPKPHSLTAIVNDCTKNNGRMQMRPTGYEPVCGYILLDKLPCEYQGEQVVVQDLICYGCSYQVKGENAER